MGRSQPFDHARHDAFQAILERYGDPAFVALKRRVLEAVSAGADPLSIPTDDRRFARTIIRVTLRQLKAAQDDGPSLAAWMAVHERGTRDEPADDPHHHEAHAS
jgi:hypothetical protein